VNEASTISASRSVGASLSAAMGGSAAIARWRRASEVLSASFGAVLALARSATLGVGSALTAQATGLMVAERACGSVASERIATAAITSARRGLAGAIPANVSGAAALASVRRLAATEAFAFSSSSLLEFSQLLPAPIERTAKPELRLGRAMPGAEDCESDPAARDYQVTSHGGGLTLDPPGLDRTVRPPRREAGGA
jgi:hypothetical protein